MKVIIERACWTHDDEAWRADLLDLLTALRTSTHHSVSTSHDALGAWCALEAPSLRMPLQARLLQSQPKADAIELRVHPDGAVTIEHDPPWRLQASIAARLVRRPLQLYLENDEHDANFLRAVLPELAAWERQNRLTLQHGGGSEMTRKIERVASDRAARWRSFFLFDSDRLHPDELDPGWSAPKGDGCQGWHTQQVCTNANLPTSRWHQLNRRSIENYLPQSLLDKHDKNRAQALFSPDVSRMQPFFNMKRGFRDDLFAKGDSSKPNAVRAARSRGFWTALHTDLQDALAQGFGSDVAKLFQQVHSGQAWPKDVQAEINQLHAALLEAL